MDQILELVTAPATKQLTTLAKLKTDLGLPTTAAQTDPYLESVIDVASDEISAFLNQSADDTGQISIGRQTVKETIYGIDGVQNLVLSRMPIGDVTSIAEDSTLYARIGMTGADGVMTAAGTTLTSASATFDATIVGQRITVTGAGASGADLSTTVASFTDANNIELTDAAGTTVGAAAYEIENPSFTGIYQVRKNAGMVYKKSSGALTTFTSDRVIVTYTSGWILPGETGRTLPLDIENACILHAGRKIEMLSSGGEGVGPIKSEEIEDVGRVEYAVAARDVRNSISGEIRSMLARYCSPGVAF